MKPLKMDRILIGVCLCFAGYLIRGGPSDPDQFFSLKEFLGSFLIFIFFLFSLVDYGVFVGMCFRLTHPYRLFSALAFGSIALGVLIQVLGFLKWSGYVHLGLLLVILLLGSLLRLAKEKSYPTQSQGFLEFFKEFHKEALKTTPSKLLLGLALLLGLSVVLRSFLLHGTTDPFMYHLLGPRLWADHGRIYLDSNYPIILNAWLWEYLYLWGEVLLGGPQGAGLIEGQFFGQWVHLFIGLGGTLLALAQIFRGFRLDVKLIFLLVIGVMSTKMVMDYASIAKNDFGAFFWALAGVAFLLSKDLRSVEWRLGIGSFLMGASVAAKPNGVIFCGLILFWTALEFGKNKKTFLQKLQLWSKGLGAFILPSLPILIRNGVFTGNPLFPFRVFGFEDRVLGPAFEAVQTARGLSLSANRDMIFGKAMLFLEDQPLFVLSFLGGLLFLGSFKELRKETEVKALWVLSFLSFLPFLFLASSPFFFRWFGPGVYLFLGFGVLFLKILFEKLPVRSRKIREKIEVGMILFLALAYTVRGFDQHVFKTLVSGSSPNEVLRQDLIHMGGGAMTWLRLNAKASDLVVSSGHSMPYYISHLNTSNLSFSPYLDRLTYGIEDPKKLFLKLRERGVRYVFDSYHWAGKNLKDRTPWGPRAVLVQRLALQFPKSVVFNNRYSSVIDLMKISYP